MKCKNCGQEYESMFCPNCGLVNPDYKTCKNCGKDYKGDFCPYCGTPSEDFYICKECGTPFKTNFCPNCGIVKDDGNVTIPKKKKQRSVFSVIMITVGWCLVGLIGFVFIIALSGAIIGGLSVNSTTDRDYPKYDQSQTTTPKKENVRAEDVAAKLNVTKYARLNAFSKYDKGNYVFLEIENPTSTDVRVSANVIFFDEDKNEIGAKSQECYALGGNSSTLLVFKCDTSFSSYRTNVSTSVTGFKCINGKMSFSSARSSDKEIITCTNNGTLDNFWVELHANVLFLKDGKAIGYKTVNFNTVSPGRSVTSELDTEGVNYDEIKVFCDPLMTYANPLA